MSDIAPLLLDGSRVGPVLAAMLLAFYVTRRAYQDATDRYKITAQEATAQLAIVQTRLTEAESRISELRTELGKCRAETFMAAARESALTVRVTQLEERLGMLPSQEGATNDDVD